ncbi:MAG TPA: nitrate ABC transporter permease [Dehalococcoidia bacterium]|nr:nitrate ABC transporter permease [Dehalococcoidia bacterium]
MLAERFAGPRSALSIPSWSATRAGLLVFPLKVSAAVLLPLLGAAALGLFWAAVSSFVAKDLPGPVATYRVFSDLVGHPFYDNGPNDKGIGVQLYASLQRVAIGFTVGTIIAVPMGVLIGISPILRRVLDPIIQVLRPVSPLAWFPIGLVTFQSAPDAAVFIITITSLWPTVINTAFGASSIPQAHKNVARVFQFSRTQYFLRIVLPYSLPFVLTGMRLSMGIAWMVIVAGEMLSGGTGIGFFIWDSWNALSLERVISAIILIGLVGVVLDRIFAYATARFSYGEVA